MRDLLMAAAERGIWYLEGLNGRGVAPDPTVVARLAQLDIALPAHPSPADETLALLDTYNAATMAMAGPRFFGFLIGGVLPAALAANWLSDAWDQNAALADVTPLPRIWKAWRSVGCAMCSACYPEQVWGSSPARPWGKQASWRWACNPSCPISPSC